MQESQVYLFYENGVRHSSRRLPVRCELEIMLRRTFFAGLAFQHGNAKNTNILLTAGAILVQEDYRRTSTAKKSADDNTILEKWVMEKNHRLETFLRNE